MKHTAQRIFRRLVSGTSPRPLEAAPRRRVWRISDSVPGGEWVDPDAAPARVEPMPDSQQPEAQPSGWLTSTMDLLGGAEVFEWPDASPIATKADSPK